MGVSLKYGNKLPRFDCWKCSLMKISVRHFKPKDRIVYEDIYVKWVKRGFYEFEDLTRRLFTRANSSTCFWNVSYRALYAKDFVDSQTPYVSFNHYFACGSPYFEHHLSRLYVSHRWASRAKVGPDKMHWGPGISVVYLLKWVVKP